MKQRIITAIFLIAAIIPIFYVKFVYNYNEPFYIIGLLLTIVATTELISMKETERKLPLGVRLFMYLTTLYLSFNMILETLLDYELTFDLLPLLFVVLAIFTVIKPHFKVNDASFVLLGILYIGYTFFALFTIFTDSVYLLLYIILIANITDTFAYFTGYYFGKHKLAPVISPKKTIEGSVGGTVIGTILVSIYAYFYLDYSMAFIIPVTFFLTIICQFGDLFASMLKRHYKIKDYGNLFPGHGGVLDRLDSVLFTSLTFYYLTYIIDLFF